MTGHPFVKPEEVTALQLACYKLCKEACGRQGYFIKNNKIEDCVCQIEFKRVIQLIAANIPKKHRDFTFEMLSEAFRRENARMLDVLEAYKTKIHRMVENGTGLYVQGQVGLAKSALSYNILQHAVEQGLTVYATRMSKITTLTFQAFSDPVAREQRDWILDDVQLLFIDEIEKDFKIGSTQDFSGTRVNEFFGDIYDNKKALILTSNMSKKELRTVHADNVVDRFQELADIVLVGESYRRPNTAIQEILE